LNLWRVFKWEVKNAYALLNRILSSATHDEVFKAIWKLKIQSKASIFAWRLIWDRLPTRKNLRRDVEINDASCPFCRNHEEDASHLFFSCDKILPLWWESMSWVNIVGAFSEIPKSHLLQLSYYNSDGFKGQRWQSWWIALTWCIWHHRNRMVFLNESFNGHKLMEDALFFCWTWFKNLEKGFDIPFHSWSSSIRDAFSNQGGIVYRIYRSGVWVVPSLQPELWFPNTCSVYCIS